MKKLIITIAIIVIAIIGLSFLIKGNSPVGSIGADVVLGKTNTYTAFTASSTASRARVVDTGRIGLEIQNIGSNNVYVFLQATSTGVVAEQGIKIVQNGSYTPEFNWWSEIWVITSTGTSTVVIQETK